jgi:hypothetical protein
VRFGTTARWIQCSWIQVRSTSPHERAESATAQSTQEHVGRASAQCAAVFCGQGERSAQPQRMWTWRVDWFGVSSSLFAGEPELCAQDLREAQGQSHATAEMLDCVEANCRLLRYGRPVRWAHRV